MKPEIKYIRKLLISELLELVDSKNTGEPEVKIQARDLKQDLEKAVDRVFTQVETEMLAFELLAAKLASAMRIKVRGGAL